MKIFKMQNNMRVLLLITGAFFIPHIVYGAVVSSNFLGGWASERAICDTQGPTADLLMTVEKSSFRGYEYYCKIDAIKSASELKTSGSAKCSAEGKDYRTNFSFTLLDGGKKLMLREGQNHRETLVRCGH